MLGLLFTLVSTGSLIYVSQHFCETFVEKKGTQTQDPHFKYQISPLRGCGVVPRDVLLFL